MPVDKKWKGYLTIEAAYVMPVVLFLYVLIILCGFYLYDRCVISQDNYLLAFRGSRFTFAKEGYGEVIYADMKQGSFQEQYIESRLQYKEKFYPFCQMESRIVKAEGNRIIVSVIGFKEMLAVTKEAEQLNPMNIIKETRR